MHKEYIELLQKDYETSTLQAFLTNVFDNDPTERDFTDPVWAEVLEMIEKKVPQKQRYTVTVTEAAKKKDCQPDTIRKAIGRGELDAIKVGRGWRIDPRSLKKWERQREHKTYVLETRFGNEPGAKLMLRVDGQMVNGAVNIDNSNVWEADVEQWEDAGVLISKGKNFAQFYRITPGGAKIQAIEYGTMFVDGCFKIEEHITDNKAARDAWRAYTNQ